MLPILLVAQFWGTSLWFAANAVMPDLQRAHGWPERLGATLASVLQAGFVLGTLSFAVWAVADRFPARRVFLASCLAGALATLAMLWRPQDPTWVMACRAVSGFCLAGIYPVGMKIASQWYRQGLGAALGALIAALILGSAFPHALRALADSGWAWPWQGTIVGVAALVAMGGLLLYFALPDPPQAPAAAHAFDWRALASLWTLPKVRASVGGYFGHMWELYTMWVIVPLLLAQRLNGTAWSWAAFMCLGAGVLGCAWGGWMAQRWGSARVATAMLATSGLCCLVGPFMVDAPDAWFYGWLVVWGFSVTGDSPQFSALTATNAPPHAVGSVLTLTNGLGFCLSIASIELFSALGQHVAWGALLPGLALGPALGVWMMRPLFVKLNTGPGT